MVGEIASHSDDDTRFQGRRLSSPSWSGVGSTLFLQRELEGLLT